MQPSKILTEQVAIYDNGGETVDRYIVIIGDDWYSMSREANSPSGVNQYYGNAKADALSVSEATGKRITSWAQLPNGVRTAIRDRMKEVK